MNVLILGIRGSQEPGGPEETTGGLTRSIHSLRLEYKLRIAKPLT